MLKVVGTVEGRKQHVCECDCGGSKIIPFYYWGRYFSCGCTARCSQKVKKYYKGHTIYTRWANIKTRVFKNTDKAYHNYGGRGIGMYGPWVNDVDAFGDYVGEPPSDKHELDRIDNDGDYAPGNMRWVHRAANQRNQRRTVLVDILGVEVPLAVACKAAGIDYYCAYAARRNGKLTRYLKNKGVVLQELADKCRAIDWRAPEAEAVGIYRV